MDTNLERRVLILGGLAFFSVRRANAIQPKSVEEIQWEIMEYLTNVEFLRKNGGRKIESSNFTSYVQWTKQEAQGAYHNIGINLVVDRVLPRRIYGVTAMFDNVAVFDAFGQDSKIHAVGTGVDTISIYTKNIDTNLDTQSENPHVKFFQNGVAITKITPSGVKIRSIYDNSLWQKAKFIGKYLYDEIIRLMHTDYSGQLTENARKDMIIKMNLDVQNLYNIIPKERRTPSKPLIWT